jgi:hypothetical protein
MSSLYIGPRISWERQEVGEGSSPPHHPFLQLTHVQIVQRRHLHLSSESLFHSWFLFSHREASGQRFWFLFWFLTCASVDDLYTLQRQNAENMKQMFQIRNIGACSVPIGLIFYRERAS